LDSFRKPNGSKHMARYFFNVKGADGEISRDREGQELADLNAARAEAVSSNREMLGERLLHGGALGPRDIEISDERGKVLATVSAKDVLMQDGQLRSFSDDVTKSAPIARSRPPEKKRRHDR
jgi:hypothetical protein